MQQKTSKSVETPEDVEVAGYLFVKLHFWWSFIQIVYLWSGKYLQPAEMSLEEIENRLGSLIQADTISLLKSTVWKERLEGIDEGFVLQFWQNRVLFSHFSFMHLSVIWPYKPRECKQKGK